jgi:hypothetical protein
MFSPDIDYLVSQEKIKDMRRDAERHQLVQIARLQKPDNSESLRRIAGWFGAHLVMWGSKLQRYQPVTQRG